MQLLSSVVLVCCLMVSRAQGAQGGRDASGKTPAQHRFTVQAMSSSGQHMSIIEYLETLLTKVDHLNFDDSLPSLYSYLGVAYHDASRTEDSIQAFKNCSRYHTRVPDPRSVLLHDTCSTFCTSGDRILLCISDKLSIFGFTCLLCIE